MTTLTPGCYDLPSPYVRISVPGERGERIMCATEDEAIGVASQARHAHGVEGAEVDVCAPTGRIVKGWTRTDGRWRRAF